MTKVMTTWGIVTIIVLFVIFAVFAGLNIMTTSNNRKIAQRQQFIPFSSVIDPTTGQPTSPPNGSSDTPFTTTDGSGNIIPQIRCPVGTKINIVGAFFDVFDPYNTCVNNTDEVSPYFGFLCIPGYSGKTPKGVPVAVCNDATDCAKYGAPGQYTCGPNNTCVLKGSTTLPSCPVWNSPSVGRVQLVPILSNGQYYCVDPNMCGVNIGAPGGTKVGVPNPLCSPNSSAKCAVRDASATVAAKCNGKTECRNLTMEDFGDYPCPGIAPVQCILGTNRDGSPKWKTPVGNSGDGTYRQGYCSLPFLQGYKGGVPTDGTTPDPANYNHGYVMHGLYTCVTE